MKQRTLITPPLKEIVNPPSRKCFSELENSLYYQAQLLQSVSDAVISTTADFVIKSWNKAAETIYGWKACEVIGKHVADVLRTTHLTDEREKSATKLFSEGYWEGIKEQKTKEGKTVTIFSKIKLIFDHYGNPREVVAVNRDITQRHKAEKELRETEIRYRELFERIKSGVAVYEVRDAGKDFIFKDFNRAGERIDNVARENLIGKSIFEVRPGVQQFGLIDVFRKVWETGESMTHPVAFYNDTVLTGWYENHVYKIGPNEIVAVFEEVTKQKQYEEALKKWAHIFQHAEWGIAVYAIASKTITLCNPRLAQIYGYTVDELIGQPFHILLTPRYRPVFSRRIKTLGHGGHCSFEVKSVHKEKNIFPASVDVSVVADEQEETLYHVIHMQDITEKKKIEMQTRKLQEQIRQAEKMQAIGQLAGGIAHDFNNILGAIIGYADMTLEQLPNDSVMYSNLQMILKACDRSVHLVNQILTFSRQNKEEKIPMYISPVAKEILDLLRPSLPSTIEIYQDIKKDQHPIMGNATQIHEIILNLCSNAIHAMKDKGVLTIGLDQIDLAEKKICRFGVLKQGAYTKLTVGDTGCGIDTATMDMIFEPFFTTKGPEKGTGMGLAVVHGAVKEHHGEIVVSSKIGTGTVFEIYFPVLKQNMITLGKKQKIIPGNGESILLVDDELFLLDIVGEMIKSLGYSVQTVSQSRKALRLFQDDPAKFDLVIADQTMPQLTGIELAQKILQIEPRIPVILCTGFSNAIDQKITQTLGIKKMLFKPVTKENLGKVISQILKRSG